MPDILTESNNLNQIDPPTANSDSCDAEVEMFADQLANLLWQQWMYKREAGNEKKLRLDNELKVL